MRSDGSLQGARPPETGVRPHFPIGKWGLTPVSLSSGLTLVELLVVVVIMGVVAAVAIPSLSPDNHSELKLAAADVAAAVRFAHSEAIRTGEPHGVHAQQSNQRIRIYRLDTSVNPFALHYDIRDPLTKQLYDLKFGAATTDVTISSAILKFEGLFGSRDYLGFTGGTGLPKYNDAGTVRMLETGTIVLSHNGAQKSIRISPMTGRVTVP